MSKAKQIVEKAKKNGYDIKLASDMKVGTKIRTGIFALDYVLDGGIYQIEISYQ